MTRPASVCSAPGCSVIVRSGSRCPAHQIKRARAGDERNTYAWQQLRREVLERDGYVCHYCGAYAETVDHIKPLAEGGESTHENCVAACRSCNSSKGARR